jgi:2-alkyl-3-oxoalkanoate reductase
MRVFVAGATGAIGRRLVPQLIERGHDVVGTYRSSSEPAERLRAAGAKMVPLDLLDAAAVRQAVAGARPDAIVHEATALANGGFSRKLDKTFAQTNRLRTAGTDALLAAAREAGVERFVAQSFAPYRYARQDGIVKTEDDPLDSSPPAGAGETNAAMAHLDKVVPGFGGIALRYGGFYGDPDDQLVRMVRKRRYPMIGDGAGVTSWIHLDDAAAATVLALDHEGPAIYNVVDDEPAATSEWLPGAGGRARGQAAPPRAGLGGPASGGRGRGDGGDPVPGRVQRQGQARARMDAPLPNLASGFRSRPLGQHSRRTEAQCQLAGLTTTFR